MTLSLVSVDVKNPVLKYGRFLQSSGKPSLRIFSFIAMHVYDIVIKIYVLQEVVVITSAILICSALYFFFWDIA